MGAHARLSARFELRARAPALERSVQRLRPRARGLRQRRAWTKQARRSNQGAAGEVVSHPRAAPVMRGKSAATSRPVSSSPASHRPRTRARARTGPESVPMCTPSGDELCSNGIDDDCDGSIDETPPCIGYVSIAAGAVHTCALRSDGQVSCWGSNEFLALGRLGAGDFPTPEPVAGVAGAAQIELGRDHSCVIRQGDSAVLCWGLNEDAQLGNGMTGNSAAPVLVLGRQRQRPARQWRARRAALPGASAQPLRVSASDRDRRRNLR